MPSFDVRLAKLAGRYPRPTPIPADPEWEALPPDARELLQTIWNRALCLGREESGLGPDAALAPWRLPKPGRGYKSRLAALLERARQTLDADDLAESLREPK
jgi:hypothetical protein